MTLKELKNYPYVVNALQKYEKELAELYDDSAGSMSPDMSGMPHGSAASGSKVFFGVERNEVYINDLKQKISEYKERLYKYRQFFASIEDDLTLQIFELRFKYSFRWEQVAAHIGGNNTENTVKKVCYRYLEKYNNDSK